MFSLLPGKSANAAAQGRQEAVTGPDLTSVQRIKNPRVVHKENQQSVHIPTMAMELCSVQKAGVLWDSVNSQRDTGDST